MTNERNWGAEAFRQPDLAEGDELLYHECGRIIEANTYAHGRNGIDYRSHSFKVVRGAHNYGCFLLVKHGAGQERIQLDYNGNRGAQLFEKLDSNERYLLMHMLFTVNGQARRHAEEATAQTYRKAFVSGALRKRKMPKQGTVKVWIDTAIAA